MNRTAKPWLFGVAMFAGAVVPFNVIAMPFLLRREGVPVDSIANISALVMMPFALSVAWSPVVDMFLSRRNWVLLGNFVSAGLLWAALLQPRPASLALFTGLLVVGNVAFSLSCMALAGLMAAVVPDGGRGMSAGWYQAGNVGSIPVLGGLGLALIEALPLRHASWAIALLAFVPALAVLFIAEPPRALAPSRAAFTEMFAELRALVKKRATWVGLALFLSPFSSSAAWGLFSGLGVDYRVSGETVLWVTGMPAGLIASVVGSLLGGLVAHRLRRRAAYMLLGGCVAAVAGAMALAPVAPPTFVVGGLLYQFVASGAGAAAYAYCLELSGADPRTAGTRMALFQAGGSATLSYMTWVDGRGYELWGPRGVPGIEALLAVVTLAIAVLLLRRGRKPTTSSVAAA